MGMSNFLNRQAQAAAPLSQEAVPVQNMSSGIGSLLEPIQAHLIQRYNQSQVVPLLNNFERQVMQLAGGPGRGMGGYAGGGYGGGMLTNPAMEVYSGQPQPRATSMGPESLRLPQIS